MEHDFWKSRWAQGQIGFHEGAPNAHLVKHAALLGGPGRVLVPLCGKAVDLAWLAARGHTVVGVELVEDAVRAFFDEQQLTPRREVQGPLVAYATPNLTVYAGDVFEATRERVGTFDALYDRAALIALPAELRGRYVSHVRGLLERGARGLLVTVEYPQAELEGPPFSVPEDEVRTHWVGAGVALVGEGAPTGGRLSALGARVRERCWALRA